MPEKFVREEEKATKRLKKMKAALKKTDAESEKIETKIKDLRDWVKDSTQEIADLVKRINTKRSDDIADKSHLVRGPPGPPGLPGMNGIDGVDGQPGQTGSKGPRGKAGVSGPQGPSGPPGLAGPRGPRGRRGRKGPSPSARGPGGSTGFEGLQGRDGIWATTGYFCPGGSNDWTRLVDCNEASCRLETQYNGQWGSVCGWGFTQESATVVCRSLGFTDGTASNHGGGVGPIWLSGVRCQGTESDIGDCPKSCGAVGSCSHGWDVGVCCVGNLLEHDSSVTVRKSTPSSFKTVAALRDACYAPPVCKESGPAAQFHQNCGPAPQSGGWHASLHEGQFSHLGGGQCDNDKDLCVVNGCSLQGNQLSALSVPSGLEVVLYERPNFQGQSTSFIGPITVDCLADEEWQGRTGSVQIKQAKPGPASTWTMRMYSSASPLNDMPDVYSLKLVGTAIVPLISFHNQYDFERFVPQTPSANYAAVFFGTVTVVKRGIYTFCTTSDDGSSLDVDGSILVENGGLHGAVQRCAARELMPGKHTLKAEMFQAWGGVFFTVTWSGPDTDGRRRLIRSEDSTAPPPPPPSTWGAVMYASPYDLRNMPDVSGLTMVGKAIVPFVDFHALEQFREYIAATPARDYAGEFFGKFTIRAAGDYTFCTVSDDGSTFWVDGDQVKWPDASVLVDAMPKAAAWPE